MGGLVTRQDRKTAFKAFNKSDTFCDWHIDWIW